MNFLTRKVTEFELPVNRTLLYSLLYKQIHVSNDGHLSYTSSLLNILYVH